MWHQSLEFDQIVEKTPSKHTAVDKRIIREKLTAHLQHPQIQHLKPTKIGWSLPDKFLDLSLGRAPTIQWSSNAKETWWLQNSSNHLY